MNRSKIVVDFFIEEDDYKLFAIENMKRANKIRRYLEMEMYNEIEEKNTETEKS